MVAVFNHFRHRDKTGDVEEVFMAHFVYSSQPQPQFRLVDLSQENERRDVFGSRLGSWDDLIRSTYPKRQEV